MDWLKKLISKRLITIFVGPILLTVIAKLNVMMGGFLTEAQVTAIIEWVLGTIAGYVALQSGVEAVKSNAKGKVAAADAANPNTSAPTKDVFDGI